MTNEKTRINPRLAAAIPYITRGGRVADIGTDHAYLPIELIRAGISQSALACDIGRGPLARAEANIAEAGLGERIQTLLTDGLEGVEEHHPTDVVIFGMGGELIARILSRAEWIKERRTNLVLQPMTKAEVLRQWLTKNRFTILNETLICEDRYYQVIQAQYRDEQEEYTEAELLLGKRILSEGSPHLRGYLERNEALLCSVIEGKRRGGANCEAEEALLADIRKRLGSQTEETK